MNLTFNVGPNRTGSSIVSRLIATFDSFDLVYEPTTLYCMMALLGKDQSALSRQHMEELIRIFVKEDLLLPRLAGRTVNHIAGIGQQIFIRDYKCALGRQDARQRYVGV